MKAPGRSAGTELALRRERVVILGAVGLLARADDYGAEGRDPEQRECISSRTFKSSIIEEGNKATLDNSLQKGG